MVSASAIFSRRSMQDAVDSILSDHGFTITEKQLVIEIDLVKASANIPCNDNLYDTIERLVLLAIERCPLESDLTITILTTERGVEIEIADSGVQTGLECPSWFSAFAPKRLNLIPARRFDEDATTAIESGCELFCTRCPQGGLAWTVVIRQSAAACRAA